MLLDPMQDKACWDSFELPNNFFHSPHLHPHHTYLCRQRHRQTHTYSTRIHSIRNASLLDIAVHKNWESHIDASHSRQPLVKGERLVRYEVNAVILRVLLPLETTNLSKIVLLFFVKFCSLSFVQCCSRLLQHSMSLAILSCEVLPIFGCVAHSNVQCQCNTRGALGKPSALPPLRKVR